MTERQATDSRRWRQEFPLCPRVVENVRCWLFEDLNHALMPGADLDAIAAAICETTRNVRSAWSHAERLRIEVVMEYGAVEIRLVPLGDDTLDDQSEWLIYRPV